MLRNQIAYLLSIQNILQTILCKISGEAILPQHMIAVKSLTDIVIYRSTYLMLGVLIKSGIEEQKKERSLVESTSFFLQITDVNHDQLASICTVQWPIQVSKDSMIIRIL